MISKQSSQTTSTSSSLNFLFIFSRPTPFSIYFNMILLIQLNLWILFLTPSRIGTFLHGFLIYNYKFSNMFWQRSGGVIWIIMQLAKLKASLVIKSNLTCLSFHASSVIWSSSLSAWCFTVLRHFILFVGIDYQTLSSLNWGKFYIAISLL